MQAAAGIDELTRPDFLARIADFLAIYAAAMDASPDELPSRQAIMERHAGYPGFRALAVSGGEPSNLVAFTYGFHGVPGQWWHDVVRAGITTKAGASVALTWLDDVMEIAEVHVHPSYQARGIGRRMVLALTAGRSERTALLSTRDAETPARRLYRSLGFADLLTDFLFPGGGPPYAVMGAVLPLAAGAERAAGAEHDIGAGQAAGAPGTAGTPGAGGADRPERAPGAHDASGARRAGQAGLRGRRLLRRNR